MLHLAARTGFAALMTLTALTGTAPVAAAQEGPRFEFGVDIDGPDDYNVDYRDRRHERRHDRDRDRRGCSPRMAEDIAGDYGMRRARVVDMTPRRVFVEGRFRGRMETFVFGNVRGCPLVRR